MCARQIGSSSVITAINFFLEGRATRSRSSNLHQDPPQHLTGKLVDISFESEAEEKYGFEEFYLVHFKYSDEKIGFEPSEEIEVSGEEDNDGEAEIPEEEEENAVIN